MKRQRCSSELAAVMGVMPMKSERLKYQPVTHATLDDFHALVQDDHVRRYL